jgi:hemolysin D
MSTSAETRPPLGRPAKALPPRRQWRAEDREFLPAALEILETPPSPVRIWLLQTICALVAISIAWMFIGRIDVVAVAQGKIQPTGRVKLVQSLETGRVREVLVGNGVRVREGQPVVLLDDSEARAEEQGLTETLAAFRAEAARRKAAIAAALANEWEGPRVEWPEQLPGDILAREQRVLSGDLGQLRSAIASSLAMRQQKEAESARLSNSVASQQELLKIEDKRVELRSDLESQKLGTKLALFDALETLQNQRTQLVQQKGQLDEAIAALRVLDRDVNKLISAFVAENGQKLADAERQASDIVQKLAKARARTAHMVLAAPSSGTVQALTITSVGQVLMPGEEVMRVVPDQTGFEIESYMPNRDIGFVKVGQPAVVKIESFPFTRYGSLSAQVVRIGTEAIPDIDAQMQEANPAKSARSTLTAGVQRMQNLVFPVTLSLQQNSINADGVDIPISNGMAVTVEVRTGERRIIDYIFSPIVEVASGAMKER